MRGLRRDEAWHPCWIVNGVQAWIVFQRTRHFTPAFRAWDEVDAKAAIAEIAADAVSIVDPTTLWPAHPMDDGVRDGHGSLYFGAAGVIWALDYLRREQVISDAHDPTPLTTTVLERNAPWFATTAYSIHASLLMGELGILLVQMRVAPHQGLADEIYTLLASNSELPIVELMWGLPGCMLGCIHMRTMTHDDRFMDLFRLQSTRLLADLEMDDNGPIWTQDLYGRRQRWLGPVHGFAGNMVPLLHGWAWLTPEQRAIVSAAVPRTLAAHAVSSDQGINWPAIVPNNQALALCQHCRRRGDGDDVRRRALHYTRVRGLASARGRTDLERWAARQRVEPLPWDRR